MLHCTHKGHEENLIQMICINPNCYEQSPCCHQCTYEIHRNHDQNHFLLLDKLDKECEQLQNTDIKHKLHYLKDMFTKIIYFIKESLDQKDVFTKYKSEPNYSNLHLLSENIKYNKILNYQDESKLIDKLIFSIIRTFTKQLDFIDQNSILDTPLVKLWNSDELFKFYEHILHHDSHNEYALFAIGNILSGQNNLDGALKFYEKCLKVNPNNTNGLNGKAYILYSLSQFEDSIKISQQTLKLNCYDIEAYNNIGFRKLNILGNSLLQLNKLDEAISYYDETLKINSSNIMKLKLKYINYQCDDQKSLNKIEDSITSFKNALLIYPKLDDILYSISIILQKKDKLSEALQYIQKALKLNCSNQRYQTYFKQLEQQIKNTKNK